MGIFGFGSGNVNQRFWQWFRSNSYSLAQVRTCQEPVANQLVKQLNKVHKGLTFLFGPVVDGRKEFIISADGDRKLFPNVQELVKAAPDIPGWKIIAFRPPVQYISEFTLTFGSMEFGADDVWFSSQRSGSMFELDLFLRIPAGIDKDTISQAAFILLDHAVGEYNVETKIGRISFNLLPNDPIAAGLRPLAELPKIIC